MTGAACKRTAASPLASTGPELFTQCPQCETIFRISAGVLGAAGGQVRCGRCGEVFDALKRLAEEPRIFAIGESTMELESRAEKILESAGDPPPATRDEEYELGEPGTAHLEVQDLQVDESLFPPLQDEADHSLEFTLAPAELDRIFIEANPHEPFPDDDIEEFEQIRDDAHAPAD